jgi:hypothetical protein
VGVVGLGVVGVGVGPNPKTPNPQSPIPNPHLYSFINLFKENHKYIILLKKKNK